MLRLKEMLHLSCHVMSGFHIGTKGIKYKREKGPNLKETKVVIERRRACHSEKTNNQDTASRLAAGHYVGSKSGCWLSA